MIFLFKLRLDTCLRLLSFLFSLGKLVAADSSTCRQMCEVSHDLELRKSRSRERHWSTWRLLLTSWMWLRALCSWVINISDKLTVSIFYAEEGGMKFHRNICKCLPIFMDISTLENKQCGLSKRRISTFPWSSPNFQKDGDICCAAEGSHTLHVTTFYKNSAGTEFNALFL
jgi:hypothetical protein